MPIARRMLMTALSLKRPGVSAGSGEDPEHRQARENLRRRKKERRRRLEHDPVHDERGAPDRRHDDETRSAFSASRGVTLTTSAGTCAMMPSPPATIPAR
jgi:hypothetical protein